jgi:TldD protein
VVSDLSLRHDEASALATVVRRGEAAVDGNERGAAGRRLASLALSVTNGKVRYEQATTDLRPAGVARAVKQLEARAPKVSGRQVDLGPPRDFRSELNVDPRSVATEKWLERLDHLFERARRVGGSRVVYRGAHLTVEDTETLFIGPGSDLAQRIVRTRAGITLVAWTGSAPTVDHANRSGTLGLEALDLSLDELEAAADRALSLLTARVAPSGSFEVVLDPTISGLIALDCLGRALEASAWHCGRARARAIAGVAGSMALGSEAVTLIDDPTAMSAYGSYFFDEEGALAKPTLLIDRGVVRGPITDRASAAALGIRRTANGRRSSPLEPVAPHLSNVAFEPGSADVAELIGQVKDGLLVENGLAVRADPRTWLCAIHASRAKQIRDGKLTGALYGNLHLRSDVPSLLRHVQSMSNALQRQPADPLRGGRGIAISAGGPHMLTKSEVYGG